MIAETIFSSSNQRRQSTNSENLECVILMKHLIATKNELLKYHCFKEIPLEGKHSMVYDTHREICYPEHNKTQRVIHIVLW